MMFIMILYYEMNYTHRPHEGSLIDYLILQQICITVNILWHIYIYIYIYIYITADILRQIFYGRYCRADILRQICYAR